jgi:hypothetical protein
MHRYVFAFALMAISALPVNARELVIGLDISDSAPLAVNQNVANIAADLVRLRIARLKMGDKIRIRSLGTYGVASRVIYANIRLGRKARPRKVAVRLANIIRALPVLVRKGRIRLQSETNIIGFLETIAPSLDCKSSQATLLILSDGIEHSSLISQRDLLSGAKKLPEPSGRILKACSLEMRGLGQQRQSLKSSARWFSMLKKQWQGFARAAGASSFKAYAEYR